VFWAAFELATIAGGAVFGGLINDVVPKEVLGRFYGIFRMISLIDGIIFNYWLTGKIPAHFSLIMTAAGIFYGVTFMIVCLKVKEGEHPPRRQPEPALVTTIRRRIHGLPHPFYGRVSTRRERLQGLRRPSSFHSAVQIFSFLRSGRDHPEPDSAASEIPAATVSYGDSNQTWNRTTWLKRGNSMSRTNWHWAILARTMSAS
jgi:hypothetical protein